MEKKEFILCAAIWYKELPKQEQHAPKNIGQGVVISGHDHAQVIQILKTLTGKRSVTKEVGEYEQGFITNLNRYVNRIEAMEIAVKACQVGKTITSTRLFSEDLNYSTP